MCGHLTARGQDCQRPRRARSQRLALAIRGALIDIYAKGTYASVIRRLDKTPAGWRLAVLVETSDECTAAALNLPIGFVW
jgi:hypothetical protein